MYVYFNPNPNRNRVGDCVIRALCKALNMEWDDVFCELSAYAFGTKDMPSANHVWGRYLTAKGFSRKIMDCDCDVNAFCQKHPEGTYILAIQGHVVCVVDGCYYDSWDSGNEIPLYYWER